MRLSIGLKMLLVAMAGLVAVGPGGAASADPTAKDSTVVIIIEEGDQGPLGCPYS